LIDSIGKKIKVAQAVADAIGLKNVVLAHKNVIEEKGKFDFVISRAVMDMGELLKLVRKNVARASQNALPNGVVVLKGGDLSTELAPFKKTSMTWDLKDYFKDEFFETKKVVYVQC
jgi:16S rRNA (guanine527-N7)-methyltransferase